MADILGLSKMTKDEQKKYELMKAYDDEETRIENIKKEQAEIAYNKKREEEDKKTIMNLKICKKYTDGATLKSLMNDYDVSRAYLNRIFKKYKIPKQTN